MAVSLWLTGGPRPLFLSHPEAQPQDEIKTFSELLGKAEPFRNVRRQSRKERALIMIIRPLDRLITCVLDQMRIATVSYRVANVETLCHGESGRR